MKFPHGNIQRLGRTVILLFLAVAVGHQLGQAQFKEDAIRLAGQGYGVGARALGMGNAYTGVASDYSALFWNPAGLAQAQYGEFSFGLSYLNNKDNATFFNQLTPYTNNATNLNTLGLVFPLPVRRGSLVLAFGFNRQSNFTSGVAFNGYNPNSSIVQSWAPDNTPYPADISMAEQLELAHADTVTGRFISPIKGKVTQLGQATEDGGLNNWSVGGAVDVAKNLAAGVTLTYLSGSYRYDRNYQEQAAPGVYAAPFDMQSLNADDFIDGDISGVNAKFGLLYRIPDRFRFGIAVKTPTAFTVKETFGTTASSTFYSVDPYGNNSYGPVDNNGSDQYDVHTPWVFSAGISFILQNLVLSGDVDYTDWTELEFANANQDVMNENRTIKTALKGVANMRAGGELTLPGTGIRLRGGFIYNPSPYKADPLSYNQKYATAGLGLQLGEASMLDLGFSHGWWDTYRVNYDATSRVDEKVTTNNFILTFSQRF